MMILVNKKLESDFFPETIIFTWHFGGGGGRNLAKTFIRFAKRQKKIVFRMFCISKNMYVDVKVLHEFKVI